MWEPQPLTTLRASTACTRKTLPLPYELYEQAQSIIHNLKFDSVTEYGHEEEDDLLTS
jgi:hypothetical protein